MLGVGVIRVEKPELRDGLETRPTSLLPLRVPVGGRVAGFQARVSPDAAVVFALTEPGALVGGTGDGFVARNGRFIRPNQPYLFFRFFRTALALGVEKENTDASGFFVGDLNLLAVAVGSALLAGSRCAKTRTRRGLPALAGVLYDRSILPDLRYFAVYNGLKNPLYATGWKPVPRVASCPTNREGFHEFKRSPARRCFLPDTSEENEERRTKNAEVQG